MTRPQRSKRGRGFRDLSVRVIDQDLCSKRAWPTFADANRALVRARIVRREGGHREHVEKRVYRCPRCGYWHLTSSSGVAA